MVSPRGGPSVGTASAEVNVIEYHERVLTLLGHLELTLDDLNWAKIDQTIWDKVRESHPEVVYSE